MRLNQDIHRESKLAEELKITKGLCKQLIDKNKEDEFEKLDLDLMEVRGNLMEKEMELHSLRVKQRKYWKPQTCMDVMEAEIRKVKVSCDQWKKAESVCMGAFKTFSSNCSWSKFVLNECCCLRSEIKDHLFLYCEYCEQVLHRLA
ncbi:Interactor of constitutive active ROPs 5 [Cardamine amara subsp. amara]|uniref:Interactor of constitutive active ROPs 5 n=1 Tax=Cardamine amara subsp. amara TaxID=228776 RepID=A0ABD0ZHH8_CARAN